ncbi:protein cortex [Pseudomyrmex gracilis]|uniref:protein cortex n=1 Tax=Pseudomyrmex gracilis TaxID=219809 RepID=UPI0009953DEF|nr:protein cortex [Pseudomyrmex gracilis]
MNRLVQDLEDQVPSDTPLRGYQPRFRRNEVLDSDTNSAISRKWFFRSDRQEVSDNSTEQCANVKLRLLQKHFVQKQIYQGDRFIPQRYGYNYEMSHHLLKKEKSSNTEKYVIDILKQIDLLDITNQRETMRAMMLEHSFISGLNQKRILSFSSVTSTEQLLNSNFSETNGSWKCIPRKKCLIKSPEQILYISNEETSEENLIDWNCNDMIIIIHQKRVKIYSNNGSMVNVLDGDYGKWSNDGRKLAIFEYDSYNLSRFMIYDVEKKKSLWKLLFYNSTRPEENPCICWSLHDRHIVVAYENLIVYESSTGRKLRYISACADDILTLSFSPNFKYLMSTSRNGSVQVYFWPELTIHLIISCHHSVQAVAWHPQVSDLVCLGKSNGVLTLWDVNTRTMTGSARPKLNGCVENLAWNKLSGELLVHWTYRERDKRYTIVTVLASFDRAVDVMPIDRETKISFLKFNSTHKEIITYSDDFFSIWNFFGNEKPPQSRYSSFNGSKRRRQGVIIHNQIR